MIFIKLRLSLVLLFTSLFVFPLPTFAGQAVLSWSPSAAPDLAGYVVYYKNDATALPLTKTQYSQKATLPATQVSFTQLGLEDGVHSFAVTAFDSSSNESALSLVVQKTILAADATPPLLSDVRQANIGSSSAQITWDSDEPATSEVRYGLTESYGLSSGFSASLSTSHSRTLTNLQPDAIYFFEVISLDAANNRSTASGQFTTLVATNGPDTVDPVIQSIVVDSIMTRSVSISWQTSEPTDSQIEYRRASDPINEALVTTLNSMMRYSHNVTLTELDPGTFYDFQAISRDAAGNSVRSDIVSFETTAFVGGVLDRTAPENPSGFAAEVGDAQATLSWKNPNDSDFVGVRVRYRTDRYPEDINDGMLLGEIVGEPAGRSEITHTGLQNGTTYYYLASSYDDSGNYQEPLLISATPRVPSNGSSSGGGGCGITTTKGGPPSRPGDAAALLSFIALLFLLVMKKQFQPSERETLL